MEKSLFTRYQKNTAMFNWSPCISDVNVSFYRLSGGRLAKICILGNVVLDSFNRASRDEDSILEQKYEA